MTQVTAKLPPVTEWFPVKQKPVRLGVYQTKYYDDGRRSPIGFSYWNGKFWSGQYGSAAAAFKGLGAGAQNKRWRGLTEEVKS